jgi:elongation factor P
LQVRVQKYGDEILTITLPDTIAINVKETEMAAKNSGATARMKKAILENNVSIDVPEFIKQGEKILVRTSDKTYVGRA